VKHVDAVSNSTPCPNRLQLPSNVIVLANGLPTGAVKTGRPSTWSCKNSNIYIYRKRCLVVFRDW